MSCGDLCIMKLKKEHLDEWECDHVECEKCGVYLKEGDTIYYDRGIFCSDQCRGIYHNFRYYEDE